jgi:hypothetical protein
LKLIDRHQDFEFSFQELKTSVHNEQEVDKFDIFSTVIASYIIGNWLERIDRLLKV